MRAWKILRDCRFERDGVRHAMLGITGLHDPALAGWPMNRTASDNQRIDGTTP